VVGHSVVIADLLGPENMMTHPFYDRRAT